ncbi:hypothetical protein ACQW5G_07450 [Fructilactobacillus sp. Tb1]|uniref:hypothetical protein n=1 Tax=Fructilactobacillus sp. Tb1 TaxID=3422304 RepID=UPI003D29B627
MKISLVNPATNQVKNAKIGFSWTTFFFGFWPALFRGDWLWFMVMLVAEILLGFRTYGFGSLIVFFIFAFVYNKLYINGLLNKGWQPANAASNEALITNGFIANNNNFNNQDNSQQNMSRIIRNQSSNVGTTILAIITAFVVVIIMFFAFGSTIMNTFDGWLNPVGVTNKIKEKVNNPNTSQTNDDENNTTTNTTSNDTNNSQPTVPTTSNENDNANSSLSNAVDKVKDQVSSITNKTDNNPSNSNNQPTPATPTPDTSNTGTTKSNN